MVVVCGSAVKEEGCSLDRQMQNSSEDRSPRKSEEGEI